jgi:RNA polymerase sigma-70 factor, ECF subfamily
MPVSDNLPNALEELTPEIAAPESPGASNGRRTAAVAVIWLQIEAEIPFLRQAARRWRHRETADADDLVQDTLIRALANAHLWEPGTNLRGWLVMIMRNQFLSNVDRHQRAALAREDLQTEASTPADAEMRLTLRDVERALRRLPANQRSAILLAGVGGKSYIEVAKQMGLSADAVRCHLARARDRLRTAVYHRDERTWQKGKQLSAGGR